jgi:methyl-accepting chemotaxis protein WspA
MNYATIRNRVIAVLVVLLSIVVITAVLGYRTFPEIDRDVSVLQRDLEQGGTLDRTRALEVIAHLRTADAAALRNLVMVAGVTIVLGSLCGFLIYRNFGTLARLVGHVQSAGIQVNSSVTQIAATAREQQATATEIAATTTEIGATSREIAATSRELLKTMNDVSSVVEQTASMAGSGQSSLARMEDTMRHVMEAAASINGKLGVLNEKAGHVNQVVTTITKVADQTNLLSLNAAIEAEKAGEFGRGFSIVATEIRRLADQTAVATLDIEKIVKEIQSAITAGVMGMDKFSEEVRRGMQEVQHAGLQLSQIIEHVQALPPRFGAVNEGMQAQATGAEQISDALRQLSEASQQTVESLRQSGEAITGLNQVAIDLRGAVSRFAVRPAA